MHRSFFKMTDSRNRRSADEGGYALLITLLFVSLFGAFLASNLKGVDTTSYRLETQATAEMLAEVARAARINTRERFENGFITQAALFDTGTATPTPAALNAAGFATLANFTTIPMPAATTPLRYTVTVIEANNPYNVDFTLVNNVVPSAFLYVRPTATTPLSVLPDLVGELRKQGIDITAARVNAAGAVVGQTINCPDALNPALIYWSGGCISAADFQAITGELYTAVPGALLIPTWRAVQFDNKILMRYPQPENPLAQVMGTDLYMVRNEEPLGLPPIFSGRDGDGNCAIADIAYQNDNNLAVPVTGLCDVRDDEPGVDYRSSIINVADVVVQNIIVERNNAGDFGGVAGDDDDLFGLTVAADAANPLDFTGGLRQYDDAVVGGMEFRVDGNLDIHDDIVTDFLDVGQRLTMGSANLNALISETTNPGLIDTLVTREGIDQTPLDTGDAPDQIVITNNLFFLPVSAADLPATSILMRRLNVQGIVNNSNIERLSVFGATAELHVNNDMEVGAQSGFARVRGDGDSIIEINDTPIGIDGDPGEITLIDADTIELGSTIDVNGHCSAIAELPPPAPQKCPSR